MNLDEFELEDFVPFLLNRAGSRIAARFTEVLKEHDVTITGWRILAALYKHKSLKVGEIAQYTSIEMYNISRALGVLDDQGLVNRDRDPADNRTVTATLTEAGEELVKKLIPEAGRLESIPLDGFSESEANLLRSMLRRLYDNMDRLVPA